MLFRSDAGALHTRLADEAYCLGAAPARDSYLNIDRIIEVARTSQAQAVHPGYGLLSESPDFAAAVEGAGLVFIGPSPEVIGIMGDKVSARAAAQRSDVPLLPGSDGAVASPEQALEIAAEVGYPLVVKACFGGGGRGSSGRNSGGSGSSRSSGSGRGSGSGRSSGGFRTGGRVGGGKFKTGGKF